MPVSEPTLLPRPRQARYDGGSILASGSDAVAVALGEDLPAEGYRLRIGPDIGVIAAAADVAGQRHARRTLDQLAIAHAGRWPCGEIVDWPDLAHRGVMLDVSRDKVPTMETLLALIDRLGSWKINHLQLYTEHTFAYLGHEAVWQHAPPFTAEEIGVVRRHCDRLGITLTANQNCLGHMERWMMHEPYRDLALSPDGYKLVGMLPRIPSTIDPDNPKSLDLVRDLLGQLVPLHDSPFVHVGLDEPWELPAERAADYLSWLARLRALPELDGREVLVWGDILANHPELLRRLPDGVTICEWGYEADSPFEARAEALADAGRSWWACPGTSSWWSVLGRTTNMVGNIAAAADAAEHHGASGWLVTEWGDNGYLQPSAVAEPGLALSAAMSWCAETNRGLDLANALSVHCWGDDTGRLAGAVLSAGDVYLESPTQFPNMAVNVLHLYLPQLPVGSGLTGGVDAGTFARIIATLDDASDGVHGARPTRPDAAVVRQELLDAFELVRCAARQGIARCEGDGTLESIPGSRRTLLADEMDHCIDRYRDGWARQNRPGGLDDSVAWLVHARDCLRLGETDPIWSGPWQTKR